MPTKFEELSWWLCFPFSLLCLNSVLGVRHWDILIPHILWMLVFQMHLFDYKMNALFSIILHLFVIVSPWHWNFGWKHSACYKIRAVEVCMDSITCVSEIWLVSLNRFYKWNKHHSEKLTCGHALKHLFLTLLFVCGYWRGWPSA